MVIGHGMVGARFVEEVRRRDPDGERVSLTVLGAESRPAYNRVLLSTVLAGGLRPAMVALPVVDGVDLHTGVAATGIDRAARVVHAADGTTHPYDDWSSPPAAGPGSLRATDSPTRPTVTCPPAV